MTSTETPAPLAPARWVKPSKSVLKSGYVKINDLVRVEAPADEVRALFQAMTEIRGIHRVELNRTTGEVVEGEYIESGWFRFYVRGTDRAVQGAANLLMLSGLREVDPNADHDHARCIASARAMGVPAFWAHTPETYLSS